jgi:hypothetical protein
VASIEITKSNVRAQNHLHPEMMNLTVKSSRAGSSSNPSRFLYPTLVSYLFRMAHTPLI